MNALQRPEIELLLCCARTQADPERASKIRQLVQKNPDWHYLLETADWHGVMPLLYWQLHQICPEALPVDVCKQLRDRFDANARRNVAMTAELLKLLNLFRSRNIPVLAYKGPVLAQLAYNNLALRQFVDLDILILESDVSAASQLLSDRGYQPQFKLNAAQIPLYIKLENECAFWHENWQINVDLHWSVMPKHFSFFPNDSILWSRRDRVRLGSQTVETFSKENLLLFLCTHSAKHNWSHLSWICDIAELLRQNSDLDWAWICSQFDKLGTRRMLFLGLYLADDILGVKLPATIRKHLEFSADIAELSLRVKIELFQNKSRFLGEFPIADIYLETMESWQDKLWYWLDAIATPTPRELAAIQLPKELWFLYYLIRPIGLVVKYTIKR